ncbi:MAG: MFS transporter [Actinomycetes bacterium]
MLRPYVDLLSTPGGLRFSAAAFVARLPIAMWGLGIVLLVEGQTGRYAVAGAVSATFALVNALAAPLIARFVDRLGQRTVLVPCVALHVVLLVVFIWAVSAGTPTWTWFASAAGSAVFAPSVGSLVRARWGYVLGPGRTLQTAYSYESVIDELIFVVGPLLVTVLATQITTQAGLLTAAALVSIGTAALVLHRVSEPPPAPAHEHGGRSALLTAGMPVLCIVMFFVGGVFGSVEISAVAFADGHGRAGLAGPLLACYAGGSMISGILFGAVHWQIPLPRRVLLGAAVMTTTVSVLPLIDTFAVLAPFLFVAGVGIAPTLISGMSLAERLVPPGKLTEGLTWATTGLIVGFSLATSLAGRIVDAEGASTAFLVALGSGSLAVVVCATGYRHLHAHARPVGV